MAVRIHHIYVQRAGAAHEDAREVLEVLKEKNGLWAGDIHLRAPEDIPWIELEEPWLEDVTPLCAALSLLLGCRVVACQAQSTASAFKLQVFDDGVEVRALEYAEGWTELRGVPQAWEERAFFRLEAFDKILKMEGPEAEEAREVFDSKVIAPGKWTPIPDEWHALCTVLELSDAQSEALKNLDDLKARVIRGSFTRLDQFSRWLTMASVVAMFVGFIAPWLSNDTRMILFFGSFFTIWLSCSIRLRSTTVIICLGGGFLWACFIWGGAGLVISFLDWLRRIIFS